MARVFAKFEFESVSLKHLIDLIRLILKIRCVFEADRIDLNNKRGVL